MPEFNQTLVLSRLSTELALQFQSVGCSLNGWGRADGQAKVRDICIFVEVENKQKHPDTNVLKYWPFLESAPTASLVLIQAFSVSSPGSKGSRNSLVKWLAERMENQFPERFKYYGLVFDEPRNSIQGITKLSSHIANLQRYCEKDL